MLKIPVISIEPLSKENIEEAVRLLHSIFTEDVRVGEAPADALWASLEPKKYQAFFKKWDIKTIEYFVAIDKRKSIIGTTGLYTLNQDPQDTVWLGWYCVALSKRGKGFGYNLLQWTVDEARKRGFSIMKLYTSNSPIETAAQRLYEKFGFKIIGQEKHNPMSKYTTIYRQRDI